MEFDLERLNKRKIELGEEPLKLETIHYEYPKNDGENLIDKDGNKIGTKGDMYTKIMLNDILQKGCLDNNPRPHYDDGQPAHTLSLNHGRTSSKVFTYDISKKESPFITLRPIAVKSSIAELLWIYQDASNNLDRLAEYGVTWWDEWDLGDRTIGSVYGETVRRYDLMNKLLEQLKKDPDGRRHIMCLWQEKEFLEPHGLKPCAYLTTFNIRHEWDCKDYLDMSLKQRSSDFCTAGCINQVQYLFLQCMVARDLGIEVGQFTWQYDNIQIYDRHIGGAIEMLNREPVNCEPEVMINSEKQDFYDMNLDDIKLEGVPRKLIKEKNPQIKFPIGI